jgi:hypothetical protein
MGKEGQNVKCALEFIPPFVFGSVLNCSGSSKLLTATWISFYGGSRNGGSGLNHAGRGHAKGRRENGVSEERGGRRTFRVGNYRGPSQTERAEDEAFHPPSRIF